jgi:hypothetical protein
MGSSRISAWNRGISPFPTTFSCRRCFIPVGQALLLALLGACFTGIIRNWRRPAAPLLLALLIHAIIGGLPDLGQLTPGPASLWIILWLPIGFICAALTQKPSAPAVSGGTASRPRRYEDRLMIGARLWSWCAFSQQSGDINGSACRIVSL